MTDRSHYPHYTRRQRDVARDFRDGFRIKPKIAVYAGIIVLAALHYFVTLSWFFYVALGFLGYAVFKLVTCGCWKSQLRTLSAAFLFILANGVMWRPLLSLGVAIMTFEMFT